MRLSEAIRLGAMNKPQAFGALADGAGTCAIGAAYDALGISLQGILKAPTWLCDFLLTPVPWSCPQCGISQIAQRYVMIAHLNDDHRWTREQIADWVETIERAHETQAETKTELVAG